MLTLASHFNTSVGFIRKTFACRMLNLLADIGSNEECCPPTSQAPSVLISDKSSTVAIIEARKATMMKPFVLSLEEVLSADELADENIVRIVNFEATDDECNSLAWKCLGYKYNAAIQKFESSDKVFPKWLAKYPYAPDLIGVKRLYSEDVDKPVRQASMDLMRSIPR